MTRILSLVAICLLGIACLAESATETDASAAAYENAKSLLEAGSIAEAQEAFRALGHYEDSAYYFYYTSARLYEQQGNTVAAIAIYNLTPEFLDCSARLLALTGGTPDDIAAAPAPTADTDFLPYHEFADIMPMQFDDYSKTEKYYVIYCSIDSDETISAYGRLFTDAGWRTADLSSGSSNGWKELYYISPADDSVYFGVQYNIEEGYAVLMYLSDVDYGFDPAEGLR